MVNHKKSIIQETRKHHETHPDCIVDPEYRQYYDNKKKKYKYYTIYTKAPRYRTYKQQCAITYRQLEVELQVWLQARNNKKVYNYFY